ncbi:RNA/RNP complex-1-interacting phosphatase [Syngnathoides biaculeatus]|uniref:RNA/RNP complex-1-interacting phosphatase n=1 Tax=Syngnathoides biaculeatus TaxID=300417 RepID=UPI002ADD62A4|nr:RNA/RNP complex-1-interacting phosphatase [Syngnathoides biaculeatus]
MSRHGRKNGIPDRWLDYRAVGKRLRGTRFVAFKVPLNQSLNRQLTPSEAFGPWELLDAIRRDGQELGLVVDLTFTTRYYRPQDLPASLGHVKVLTKGHVVPADNAIFAFKRAVRRFLRENADNDKLIGVHCTHGLNRTGYMICRYLIDVDGMDPDEAIQLFNSCRGHDMERSNYIDDLRGGRRRSNKGMDRECPSPSSRGRDGPQNANGRRSQSGSDDGRRFFPPGAESRRPPEWPRRDGPPRIRPRCQQPLRYQPPRIRPHQNHPQRYQPPHIRPQRYQPPLLGGLLSPPARPPARLYGQASPRAANRAGRPQSGPRPSAVLPRYIPRWANQQNGDDQGWC